MLIGELSKASGFSCDTIRYYAKYGLLENKNRDRRDNNYKEYSKLDLSRLIQIRRLKECGFTLKEIGVIVILWNNPTDPCAGLPNLLERKLASIDRKMALLMRDKQTLLAVKYACDGSCVNGCGMPTCFNVNSG